MSYIKRSIVLDDEVASEPSGAPVLGGRKIEPMGRTRPPLRIWSVIPTELAALLDAVESAAEEGSGFDLFDIEQVEAFWQILEPCSAAHGYVLTLRGGSRVYLQLLTATDDDRPIEEVEVLPMRHERYPDLKGAHIAWIDDVDELNRFLKV
jgi:hypothetical protein